MNTKRILYWAGFIIIIVLVIWGMIAAGQKASRESVALPLPDKITSDDWTRGNASSTVTLVEYSDFQCPACYSYFPMVEKLFKESSTTILMVYRHFPLPQHANAIPASKASEAAGKQGKFWEMYNIIFTNHDLWENSTDAKTIFTEYAKKLGLDMTKFASDYALKEIEDKITTSVKAGSKAGINSTPTFYLNGKKIKNPSDYVEFKKLIDEAAKTKN